MDWKSSIAPPNASGTSKLEARVARLCSNESDDLGSTFSPGLRAWSWARVSSYFNAPLKAVFFVYINDAESRLTNYWSYYGGAQQLTGDEE